MPLETKQPYSVVSSYFDVIHYGLKARHALNVVILLST